VNKIRRNLPPSARSAADEITQFVAIRRQTSETSPPDRSSFEMALRAIATRRQLRITVAEAGTGGVQTTLNVYRILYQGERWHLVGFSSFHREVCLIEFAMVRSIEQLPSSYAMPERFNLDRFLQHSPVCVPTPLDAAPQSDRRMRIDPGSRRDDRAVPGHVIESFDELHHLLHEFSNELGPHTSAPFRARLAECIERLHSISAELTATVPVLGLQRDELQAG
jgi:hypothetical protein